MTKSITLGTIICLLTLILTLSFKPSENEKKNYVSIYYNNNGKEATLSYSDGTLKKIEVDKPKGICDQTQLLKIISEHEALGYKLVNYDTKFPVNVYTYAATVLLVK